MKLNSRFLPVFIISIVLFSCSVSQGELSTQQKKLVEEYVFTDWHGNDIAVQSFEGSFVVLDFWESWCGPCLSSFPGFQRAVEEFPDDIVIIAATVGWNDGREEAVEFKTAMNYDFYFVDGKHLSGELGFSGIPFKIILNRDGKVESVQSGSSGAQREYEKLVELIKGV